MEIADRYKWEAETSNGEIIAKGGDLTNCVRFSLIPADGVKLPRHDICGVPLKRRFMRMFKKIRFNDTAATEDVEWEHGSFVINTFTNMKGLIRRGDLIQKRRPDELWYTVADVTENAIVITNPYQGKTKKAPARVHVPKPNDECLHCVVCENYRLYVKSTNGSALITPEDYEMYL
jgi:hypothetical protein